MQIVSLFSGMGGFELAGEWMGWRVAASCEINPFGQKILKYYWANAYHHDNVKTLDYEQVKKNLSPDDTTILVAGFPCQPFSTAGKRLGTEDDRYGWPDCVKAIRELRPGWCVFENVRGLTNWNGGMVFDEVQADLEAEGYEVLPFLLPACGVGAPHRRDRIWFVAYRTNKEQRKQAIGGIRAEPGGIFTEGLATDPQSQRNDREQGNICETNGGSIGGLLPESDESNTNPGHAKPPGWSQSEEGQQYDAGRVAWCQSASLSGTRDVADPKEQRLQERDAEQVWDGSHGTIKRYGGLSQWRDFPTQPPIRSRNDGIPAGLVLDSISQAKHRTESIKAYGNAIVPQVAYEIFKAIQQYESRSNNNSY